MMEFESINYVTFEGELLQGTIGYAGKEYSFTRIGDGKFAVGNVEASFAMIKDAIKQFGKARMEQYVGDMTLNMGHIKITVAADERDAMEREFNSLVSAWTQKE